MTWDLRPESILPAGFIYKAGHSEGTELCQASWLPGSTPQHRRSGRTIRYPGPKQGAYPSPHSCSTVRQMTGEGTVLLQASRLPGSTPKHMTVRKNDSVPRAETGGVSLPAFLLNCKADDSEGTELCQGHHGCRGQLRSRDSPEERYKTASRKTRHVPTSLLFNPAADDSEGTELCQGHPGCRVQRRSRDSPEERYKTASRKTVIFPRPCSIPQQMTGEGTEFRQASWLPGPTPQHRRSARTIPYPTGRNRGRVPTWPGALFRVTGPAEIGSRILSGQWGGITLVLQGSEKGIILPPFRIPKPGAPRSCRRPGFRGYPPEHRPGGRRPRGRRGETISRYYLSGQGGPLRLPCSAGPGPLPR